MPIRFLILMAVSLHLLLVIINDMSNNYKDNAQDDLKELEATMNAVRNSGKIKDKVIAKYEAILDEYKEKMKGYSHKDQKPYWH